MIPSVQDPSSASHVQIGDRLVGSSHEPYIVAEMSANHCGSLDTAHQVLEAAADAGADAIKLQHYRPESITVDSDLPEYRIQGGTLWDGRTLFDLYGDAMTPWEWTDELIAHANRLGLHCFSSPFDEAAVDYLEQRHVPAFKIASFELVHLPLIQRAAMTKRPIILSTGMATESEIDGAVRTVRSTGNQDIVVLRCSSAYPANTDELNLLAITEITRRWGVVSGFSDHTEGSVAAVASLGLGASMFEKHIALSRESESADAKFSLDPGEFKKYVADIRQGHRAIGKVVFGPSPSEIPSLAFKRSVRAITTIAPGQRLTLDNVAAIRPSGGLLPEILFEVDRYQAVRSIAKGEAITLENVTRT